MKKFKKKPVVIEAVQLTEEIALDCLLNHKPIIKESSLSVSGGWNNDTKKLTYAYVEIPTLEGLMTAKINDWIIKGINGEFYPCKPDIFEKTYEPVL